MVSQQDVLLTFLGRDEASHVMSNIQRNAQDSLNGISGTADRAFSDVGNSVSTFSSIQSGLSSMNQGMMQMRSASDHIMSSLGSGKTASELIFGTSSKQDTNKVLLGNMADATASADDLFNKIDDTTNRSLTSMQDLIPAMNAFKSASGASAQVLKDDVTDSMANFGAFVLAQTGSADLSLTAMMNLSKGLKGAYSSLDQYGISEEALQRTGLWKEDPDYNGKGWRGDPKDVEGYMAAIEAVTGSTEELMNTNEGLNAQIGKAFSRAGKKIGNEFLPQLKSAKQIFLELDKSTGGQSTTALLLVAAGIEEVSSAFYNLNMIVDGIGNVSKTIEMFGTKLGLISENAENFSKAMGNTTTASNTASTEANTAAIERNTVAREENIASITAMDGAMTSNDAVQTAQAVTPEQLPTQSTSSVVGEAAMYGATDYALSKPLTKDDDISKRQQSIKKLTESIKENQSYYDDYEKALIENIDMNNRLGQLKDEFKGGVSQFNIGSLGSDLTNNFDEIDEVLNHRGTYKVRDTNITPEEMRNWEKILYPAEDGLSFEDVVNKSKEARLNDTREAINVAEGFKDSEKDLEAIGDIWYDAETGGYTKLKDKVKNASARIKGIDVGESIRDAGTSFGGKLQNGLKTLANVPSRFLTSMKGIRSKFSVDVVGGISGLFSSVSTKLKGIRAAGFEGNMNSLFAKFSSGFDSLKSGFGKLGSGLGGIFSKAKGASEIAEAAEEGAEVVDGAKKMAQVADGAEDVVETGSKVATATAGAGAVGGEMAAASGGLSFMALAEMGLAGAFTTLIVPTLAVAAVIAVLIPVVAGLAIEAMFFISLVARAMQMFDFGSINVDGAADGLRKLAESLAWLAAAMGSLSLVGLLTGLAVLYTGFGQVEAVMGTAKNMLTKAIQGVNEIANAGEVNPNAANSLKNLSTALSAIGGAMNALTGVSLSAMLGNLLTFGGRLGTVSGNFEKAKGDLQKAVGVINQFDFSGIDESKIGKIKNTLEAIKAFGDAFSSLTKIQGDKNWSDLGAIFGDNIEEAFNSAHDDLVKASQSLKQYGDIDDVPDSVAGKLSKVSESLKSVADGISSLRKLRDDYNWDDKMQDIFKGGDITSVLDNVHTTISESASKLNSFQNIPDVQDGLATKVNRVADATKVVGRAVSIMNNIEFPNVIGLAMLPVNIGMSNFALSQVAYQLRNLQGIPNVPDGLATKVNRVATATKVVGRAVSIMNNITFPNVIGMVMIPTNIGMSRFVLFQVAAQLNTLNSIHSVPDGIATKVSRVATATKLVGRAVSIMNNTTFPNVLGMAMIPVNIGMSRFILSQVATQLQNLQGIPQIPDGIATKVSRVATATKVVGRALNIMNNTTFPNVVGLAMIPVNIAAAKGVLMNTASRLSEMGGIANLPDGLATRVHRVGVTARRVGSAVRMLNSVPMATPGVSAKIGLAVNAVRKAVSKLNKLQGLSMQGGIGHVLAQVRHAVTQLRATIARMGGGFRSSGNSIGLNLKSGLGQGLNGLSPVVTSKLSAAINAGSAKATSGGSTLGKNATTGFKNNLKLAEAINNEITNIINTINQRAPEVSSATANLTSSASTSGATDGGNGDAIGYGPHGVKAYGPHGGASSYRKLKQTSLLNSNRGTALRRMRTRSNMGRSQKPVHINVGEGAIKLDARNLTTKESRQIMINAIEGLDAVKGIDI